MTRTFLLVVLANLAVGCTIERIEQDTTRALAIAGATDQLSIERSSRWRLDDPGYLTFVAEYNPEDQAQVALLHAAFSGVSRVYPQAVLDPSPVGAVAPIVSNGQPVELLMHVDIPGTTSSTSLFPVALVDARTGNVIDRATLALHPGWWGSSNDPGKVAQLFHDYAAQLRPSQ